MTQVRHWLKAKIKTWLDRRIPARSSYQLNLSNIFILPSRFGALYLCLCVLLFILGSNYNNNLMLLLCFFLIALFLINLTASYHNFAKIYVQLGRLTPVFAGEEALVPIWFGYKNNINEKLPYQGNIYLNQYPDGRTIKINPNNLNNPALVPYTTSHRGIWPLPRLTIYSIYPLGLYRCWTHLHMHGNLTVYPQPIMPPRSTSLASVKIADESHHGNALGTDDFDTIDKYQVGEPLNQIAWKQVAKGQKLVSKKFVTSQSEVVWLNLPTPLPNDIELALSHLTWQILDCDKQRIMFGLTIGTVTIAPNSGTEHTHQCLHALAEFQPNNLVARDM